MSGYVQGETSDLFDPTTGAWVGVLDRRGQEQLVAPGVGAGVTDGDKGDIIVSGDGTSWDIDPLVLSSPMRAVTGADSLATALSTLGGVNAAGAKTAAVATDADLTSGDTTMAPRRSAVTSAIAAAVTSAIAAIGTDSAAFLETGFGSLLPNSNGSATVPQAQGMGVPAPNDSSVVAAASATDGTGSYPGRRKVRYNAATTAVNRVAGFASPSTLRTGYASRFPYIDAGAIADASPASGSFLLGLAVYPLTFTNVEPSSVTNAVFLGFDSGDTNMQIMHNDGAGACTKIDLGASFPRSQFVAYQIVIDNPTGDGTTLTVQVKNLNTLVVSQVYTLTTNLPVTSTVLSGHILRSSLGTSFLASIDFVGMTTGKVPKGAGLSDTNFYTRSQTVDMIDLTDAATIAVDAALSNNFRVVLGGNRTLDNPTNLADGWTCNIKIKQDGTGSRTLAYGSKWKFPGGAPTLSTAASAIDSISGVYDSTDDIILANIGKAYA